MEYAISTLFKQFRVFSKSNVAVSALCQGLCPTFAEAGADNYLDVRVNIHHPFSLLRKQNVVEIMGNTPG